MAQYLSPGTTSQIGNWVCTESSTYYEYRYFGLQAVYRRRPVNLLVYEARWAGGAGAIMETPAGYKLESVSTIREFDAPLTTRTRAAYTSKGAWVDVD